MEMMQTEDLDVVFCSANIIVDNEVVECIDLPFNSGTVLSPDKLVELSLKDEIGSQAWSRLCHKQCWDGVRFPKGRIYEDLAIGFYPFVNAKKCVGFLNVPLYNYRLNYNGISLSKNPEKSYHIFLGLKEHYEYATTYCKDAESCCLSKAVSYGLGAYGTFLFESESVHCEKLKEISKWLKNNKTEICKCKDIDYVRKTMALMLLYTRPLYKLLNNISKVKELSMNKK